MTHLKPDDHLGLPYKPPDPPHLLQISDLEEFHERHANDTFWARVVMLTLIFGMLSLNLWMTQRNYDALITDVDAQRTAMSEIHEQTTIRLEQIEKQIAVLQAQLPQPQVAVAE